MSMEALADAALIGGGQYPAATDPVTRVEQQVQYSYWPVSYQFGDPTVISNVSLPLSGVQFSEAMRSVGEFRAQLQLASDDVRAIYPWDKIMPRKTGIVVVRSVFEPFTGRWLPSVVQHYIVWKADRNPLTGRMSIYGTTVEGLWSRRLITKAMSWSGADQTTIAADLLLPTKFSKIVVGGAPWPGWITVDPPVAATGVARTFSYADGQETNLLEAHQNRSQLATNPYEWYTRPRVLSGADAESANTFRLEFQMGFPRLGREIGGVQPVPRVRFDRTGAGGNVTSFELRYDGSTVPNIVWARGKGYDTVQTKTVEQNIDAEGIPEWRYGFLQTESKFSDPDVSDVATLGSYAKRFMWERLGSEQYISSLLVKGNMPPYFGSYLIGDDIIVETNDLTWPTDFYDSTGFTEFSLRIFGWVVTPPEGNKGEDVQLLLSGGNVT